MNNKITEDEMIYSLASISERNLKMSKTILLYFIEMVSKKHEMIGLINNKSEQLYSILYGLRSTVLSIELRTKCISDLVCSIYERTIYIIDSLEAYNLRLIRIPTADICNENILINYIREDLYKIDQEICEIRKEIKKFIKKYGFTTKNEDTAKENKSSIVTDFNEWLNKKNENT